MTSLSANLRTLLLLILALGGYYGLAPYFYADLNTFLSPWMPLVAALPYIVAVMILLVSWHFHNSKPALVAVLICIVNYWLQNPELQRAIWSWTLLVLLSLWMLLLSRLPERPLLSRGALLQLLLLILPAALLVAIAHWDTESYLYWLTYEPAGLLGLSRYLPYPAGIVVLQSIAVLTLVILLLRYRQQQEIYLLLTLCLLSWLVYGPVPQLERWLLCTFLLVVWLLAILIYGHNLAYLDELTGLPGRRALNQARARLGRRHVIAMLDVDHFKKFNDTYGHDVGDQVLKMVASRLRSVRGGTAYRYGGEEFSILFPGTQIENAHSAAEEVRLAVANASMQLRSKHRPKSQKKGTRLRGSGPSKDTDTVSVTISIGLAENSGEDTLKEADKKLYQAKQQGRNQVCY